jgi:hypothetical protein
LKQSPSCQDPRVKWDPSRLRKILSSLPDVNPTDPRFDPFIVNSASLDKPAHGRIMRAESLRP